MSKRDFYEVLGVSKTASDEELKKAMEAMAAKIATIATTIMTSMSVKPC